MLWLAAYVWKNRAAPDRVLVAMGGRARPLAMLVAVHIVGAARGRYWLSRSGWHRDLVSRSRAAAGAVDGFSIVRFSRESLSNCHNRQIFSRVRAVCASSSQLFLTSCN